MKVIKSTKIIYCDVDETLILWEWKDYTEDISKLVSIRDPDSGVEVYGLPHNRHIELLKQFKSRGHTVVVWSQGGAEWAERAVMTLEIDHLVDVVLAKPDWYIDDLHANAFMESPIYLDPMNPLKDKRAQGVDDEDEG